MMLTDNEIIKALECCADEMGCIKGCPCFDPKAKGSHCTVSKKLELEKLTLDLINRQKAEIEQTTQQRDFFAKQTTKQKNTIDKQEAEIERLQKDSKDIDEFARNICKERLLQGKAIADFDSLRKYIETQKVEAYNEFAYKLKQIPREIVYKNEIDNLSKELVGGAELPSE